jgi:hypothetical protein
MLVDSLLGHGAKIPLSVSTHTTIHVRRLRNLLH